MTITMYSIRRDDVAEIAANGSRGDQLSITCACAISTWAAKCAEPRCIVCKNAFDDADDVIPEQILICVLPGNVLVAAACQKCVGKHDEAFITDKAGESIKRELAGENYA